MAYSADTFSAGEVPTTSKWNKLWTNDASFNDGSGIANLTIGAVTAVKNSYKFSVYLAANQTGVADSVLTKVNYDTKRYDTSSNVDVVTNKGRFTAPVSGYYFINCYVLMTFSNGIAGISCISSIYVNGSEYRRGDTVSTASATFSVMTARAAETIFVNAGDYIEHYAYGDVSAGTVIFGSGMVSGSSFSGFLVSAT